MEEICIPNLFKEVEARGMESIHFPIKDKWIPNSMDDLIELVEKIIVRLRAGKKVVVHCNGGKGRSGTVLVATLVGLGRKVQQAIDVVRKTRSGTIRNPLQIAYVKRFKTAWIKHKQQLDKNFKEEVEDEEAGDEESEINLETELTEPINENGVSPNTPARRMTVSTYKVESILPNITPSTSANAVNSPQTSGNIGKSIRNLLGKNHTGESNKVEKRKKNDKLKKKDSKKTKKKTSNSNDVLDFQTDPVPVLLPDTTINLFSHNPIPTPSNSVNNSSSSNIIIQPNTNATNPITNSNKEVPVSNPITIQQSGNGTGNQTITSNSPPVIQAVPPPLPSSPPPPLGAPPLIITSSHDDEKSESEESGEAQ